MRALAVLPLLALAAPAGAQPTHPAPDLAAYATVAGVLPGGAASVAAPPADWEPPPGLYWAGVGVDATALAGGAYVFVQGLRLLDLAGDEGAGPGAPAGAIVGALLAGAGGLAAVAGGADLAYVVTGGRPALARAFDPGRFERPPRRGPLE